MSFSFILVKKKIIICLPIKMYSWNLSRIANSTIKYFKIFIFINYSFSPVLNIAFQNRFKQFGK